MHNLDQLTFLKLETCIYYFSFFDQMIVVKNWWFLFHLNILFHLKSFVRVNIKTFLWKKYAENVHQKLVPEPFLIFGNVQNSQCTQESSLEPRYFEIGLFRKTFKKVKIMKNKRSLEIVTSLSLGCNWPFHCYICNIHILFC